MKRRPLHQRLARAAYGLLPSKAQWLVRELAGSPMLGGLSPFRAARRDHRTKDLPTQPWTCDAELRNSLRPLRAAARDADINSPHIKWFLGYLARHWIGPAGITSRAQIRDRRGELMTDVNQEVTARWREWSEQGPVSRCRRYSLAPLSRLYLQNVARDGEMLPVLMRGPQYRHGLAIEGIDADRLDERLDRRAGRGGPEIRLGVEVDSGGGPTAFHLRGSGLGDQPLGIGHERISAFNPITRQGDALHLFVPRRLGQTRGPSWFYAALEKVHGLDRYTLSAIYAAEKASDIAGWLIPGEDEEETELETNAEGEAHAKPRPEEIETEPGIIFRGRPGDTISTWRPEHPQDTHATFRKAVLQDIGAAIDALYFQMGNDLENVNYSSSRTGLLDIRDVNRLGQRWWIDSYHRYVYESWIEQALLMGVIPHPLGYQASLYYPAKHRGRGWDWTDPQKEWLGIALAWQMGGTSMHRVCEERGEDFEEIVEEIAQEQKFAKDMGKKYGVTVSIQPSDSLGSQIALAYIQEALAAKAGKGQ